MNFILQTIDPGNSVMRKTCLQSSMTALKDVARVFPMVALNDTLSRLAVGDAIGDIKSASICVYDMQRYEKLTKFVLVIDLDDVQVQCHCLTETLIMN